jgi:hypothetical protein
LILSDPVSDELRSVSVRKKKSGSRSRVTGAVGLEMVGESDWDLVGDPTLQMEVRAVSGGVEHHGPSRCQAQPRVGSGQVQTVGADHM